MFNFFDWPKKLQKSPFQGKFLPTPVGVGTEQLTLPLLLRSNGTTRASRPWSGFDKR
jgi:hypothetical protein